MTRRFPVPRADLRERYDAIMAGSLDVPATRDAATIALVRDGDAGLEVYLMRRTRAMSFAGGMHVFPGGGVDPGDAALPAWVGPGPRQWATWFGTPLDRAGAVVAAAVRETFEECGVLLAGTADGTVLGDVGGDDWERDRREVEARTTTMPHLLERRGLALRADLLVPLAHWVTPTIEERRYDTHFFLARLPEGQQGRTAGTEADQRLWIRPQDALAANLAMLPPTIVVLSALSAFDDVDTAMAAERAIATVQPRPVLDDVDALHLEVD